MDGLWHVGSVVSAVTAVLCATDSETALWPLAGTPLVVHAARLLPGCGLLERPVELECIVVAGGAAACAAVAADLPDLSVIPVDGGLPAALRVAASGSAAVVVVHEAARALAPAELLTATIATVRAGAEVAVPVTAVSDTIKHIADDGTILSTVDRSALRTVQAPYCFDRQALIRLLENGTDVDRAWQLATSLTTVPGHADAFAIDSPAARSLAGQVLARRSVRA